jgi:hypothetical protein
MIIRPTVWVPGLGPNSGFDFRAVILQTGAQRSWSSETARKRFPPCLWVERRGRTIDRKSRYYKTVFKDSLKLFHYVFSIASFEKKE